MPSDESHCLAQGYTYFSGTYESNVLSILPQFRIPLKGYPRFRVPLMPNESSATIVHSSNSPPAQFCFPHSLRDSGSKSTSYQTTCLRISIFVSTSMEIQTMIDDFNLIFRNLSQILYPLFFGLLHTKSSKIFFSQSSYSNLKKKILEAVFMQSGIQFWEYIYMW